MRMGQEEVTEGAVEKRTCYTLQETAEMLRVHPATVRRAIKAGVIKVTRLTEKGTIRITPKEYDRLLTRGTGR